MLNLFRKHAKSWLIKAVLLLIVVVFIFWGGYSYQDRERNQLAKVGDYTITFTEYNRAYDQLVEMYRRQLGGAFSPELIRQFNLRRQALDMLIERYLLLKAARELGIAATVQEIQNRILQYPVFQVDGKFDERQYRLVLQQNRMTPETFEQQLGEDLSLMKVEEFIKRRALVTEDEILSDLRFNYAPIEIAYVVFDPETLKDRVNVKEETLEAFFKENEAAYQEPEKRQIVYVLFKHADFVGEIGLTEEELRRKYEERRADFHHPPQVHALHILFRLDEGASEEDAARVRSEAERVLAEARQGKDFSELARNHSQDPSVADNGGDLGWFSRDRMIPEFSDAAFSLEEGQISDLVRTAFGYHIIKVLETREEKTESFEEVKERLEASIKEERAEDLSHKKALEFSDMAFGLQDLARAAEMQKQVLRGAGTWVSQRDPLPGLETATPEVMRELFSLEEKAVSKVLEIPEGFLVASVDAVQPPRTPPLETVRDRVVADLKAREASTLARDLAASFLEAAVSAGSLEKAASEKNMEVKKSGWFSRMEPSPDLGELRGPSLDALFELEPGRPLPNEPLSMGNRYVVAELLGKREASKDDTKQWESISARLLQQKQAALWNAWLEEQRARANIKMLNEI